MKSIHPDLFEKLSSFDPALSELFLDLREFIYSVYPESNELLYHTHALTSVFTPTLKMGDGFCHTPMYTNHVNLGLNRGTMLEDPHGLLHGTGKLIRHVPIKKQSDYRNSKVKSLLRSAVEFSLSEAKEKDIDKGKIVSKYRKKIGYVAEVTSCKR